MREINYKTIKTLIPYCSECGKKLIGDNSKISPYRCSCGVWRWDNKKKEWYIKKEDIKINI